MLQTTLKYYYKSGSCIIFNKYTIDTSGVIRNNKTGRILSTRKTNGYNICSVRENSGKKRDIRVCRAVLSTFEGPPKTLEHTTDHINRVSTNDTFENLRWETESGQKHNRTKPKELKSAIIIVKDDLEKTSKDWIVHLKGQTNPFGREYTINNILNYAQRKQHGFSYKEYPAIPGEVWKKIIGTNTTRGRWEISNMCRIKYITNHTENVLSGGRLCIKNGYPKIKLGYCHVLSFLTFFPEEYAAKKPNEVVLHENDDKMDFRPHKLRLGTLCENAIDAHNNGKHKGKKSERVKCASYINDVLEKEYDSQSDAVTYLRSIGYTRAQDGMVSRAIVGDRKTAYGRTWKKVHPDYTIA